MRAFFNSLCAALAFTSPAASCISPTGGADVSAESPQLLVNTSISTIATTPMHANTVASFFLSIFAE
jgi:hypothetical protein